MKIVRTKCDHCNALHGENSNMIAIYGSAELFGGDALEMAHFDFCNEDCLREFFVKRGKKEAEAK